jgi:hypothetical protein
VAEELDWSETEFGPAQDIIGVEVLGELKVKLTFEDNVTLPVDLTPLFHGPVFEQIINEGLFGQVRVDARSGTITWPNGVEPDPWVLRQLAEDQAK